MTISDKKLGAALRNLVKAAAASAARPKTYKECAHCKQAFRVKPSHYDKKTYCSKACMAEDYKTRLKGAGNPNHGRPKSACLACGALIEAYAKGRKYCSMDCYAKSGALGANAVSNGGKGLRTGGRRDQNHKEIVRALEAAGCFIIDMADLGKGCPDIAVGRGGTWYVMEIKNPKTAYGRRGLNENQKRWVAMANAPVHVVESATEALSIVFGVDVLKRG